ncbi:anti-sigma factor RsbA family regulatory protein [Geodermatophilus sp. URMC 61]|uniref:anti-sigma factor RsbA family regulatory protein n=1 Tax=Geodermatophilus sp. URMC 61 TaxID=3423411 RepID=UPI00406D0EFC
MRTGAARGYVGNFHEAGFYSSDAEFLALIHPFVTEGVAAGEPVIIGYDERKCDLLRSALPRPERIAFLGDTSLYASPARAIEAYRQQFERLVAAGAGQIRIAGDVPHEGNGGRFASWDRYESAVNVVWQHHPVWSRCLYDATTVPDDVRDVVERTHRRLVTPDGGAVTSTRYQDVPEFEGLPPAADPLEATAPSVCLGDASLKQTRRRVAEAVRGHLDTAAFDELVFALSEAVINAQSYGRPPVGVRVWTAPHRVVVRVRDSGPGPLDPLTGLVPVPESSAGAGLGLWLSHQLTGVEASLITDAGGFTVRLRAGAPPAAPADAAACALRAGTLHGALPTLGTVHAIDGDGSSLCEAVDAVDLHPLDGLCWRDLPAGQQCPHCRMITDLDDGSARP